jgi:hypothetical protein
VQSPTVCGSLGDGGHLVVGGGGGGSGSDFGFVDSFGVGAFSGAFVFGRFGSFGCGGRGSRSGFCGAGVIGGGAGEGGGGGITAGQ